ncbi:guanitoxin biosynthesis heme-dependent pre-guanitoxin N-hydroxylase GntA [Pontibacter harenae]|uniref:guanitoxin biosynthesis heme-dependent pre-guanitoxin N-hydroxylase GntA n=1 Tax=Pontibacter harenae TaxID=2894083 RepID=UPI001E3682E9|nr:guanitoxin biosynthesis heme-dependent pre-guanitoxin N-hydroxylase GntA [Pontibacter harenae]MCC9169105.1 YqcI/YcgG family protein [Pontibacter harenae]
MSTKTYFTPEELESTNNLHLKELFDSLTDKVGDMEYPCVGAKAALNSGQLRIGVYNNMATDETTMRLGHDLKHYIAETLASDSEYMTMVAFFREKEATAELNFENNLWAQLQLLHNSDNSSKPWDPEVSSNPADTNFSFSYNGTAFFVVGLHPNSSRKARRLGYTAMAFNLHRQFEQLRQKGVYENMKKVIRERDIAYDGTINPMLKDFDKGLEAPQYSGRHVEESWKCPFLAGKL